MRNKKGAMELSMSTIIIIVIGVTLLILGLAFVKQIFSKTEKLGTGAFDQAEAMLSQVDITDEFLTVTPLTTSVEKGELVNAAVVINNINEAKVDVKVTANSIKGKLDCLFAETQTNAIDKPIPLSGGDYVKLAMIIQGLDVGIDSCAIEVVTSPLVEEKLTSAIVVTVE
ncbi:hypothetical protein J4436_01955 [Candidatus Woesearchaeota archaeon]|nr:hypothetical protein [Candidatus Woesearchaeota archaeon]